MPRKTRVPKRTTVPRLVCAVVVTTATVTAGGTSSTATREFRSVSYIAHRRIHGRWVFHSEGDFDDRAEFWRAYLSADWHGHECYTVCPDAGAMLGVLGWWGLLSGGGVACHPGGQPATDAGGRGRASRGRKGDSLILSGCPDVISFRARPTAEHLAMEMGVGAVLPRQTDRPARFRWVGTRQFGEPDYALTGDSHADCRIVSEWFRHIIQRWSDSACGAWRDTAGAASWSTYAMRSARMPITDHARPAVLKLEDAACHGGRASIFTTNPIGDRDTWNRFKDRPAYPLTAEVIPGPLHRLDVKAMYPSIMSKEYFPTRIVGLSYGWSLDRLERICSSTSVLARLTVKTARSALPRKGGTDTAYPVGSWISTLATPEILAALYSNEVVKVHEVARYESGKPFEDWGKWILGMRRRAVGFGGPDWASYVKKIAVSLSGRLARKPAGWEARPGVIPPVEWGEWYRTCADTGKGRRFRSLGGIVQELVVGDTRPGTFAACYAHITSYGRVQMNRYREIAGHRQVIAQHTDGLVVTDLGLANLEAAGCVRKGEFGHLEYQGKYDAAWYRSPNHFWADGKWTMAGVAAGFSVTEDGWAESRVTLDPVRSARDPSKHPIRETIVRTELSKVCPDETVGPDGWVIPPAAGRVTDRP